MSGRMSGQRTFGRYFGCALAGVFALRSFGDEQPRGRPDVAGVARSGAPPDESVLGTLDINGSATAAPLPKLAVMPIVTTGDATRRCSSSSSKTSTFAASSTSSTTAPRRAPSICTTRRSTWRLARQRDRHPGAGPREQAAQRQDRAPRQRVFPRPRSDPVFQHRIETEPSQMRTSSHRMTDALLGALTGRPGGFASHLVYSGRVASNRNCSPSTPTGFICIPRAPRRLRPLRPRSADGRGLLRLQPRLFAVSSWCAALRPRRCRSPFLARSSNRLLGRPRQDRVVGRAGGSTQIYVGNADAAGSRACRRRRSRTIRCRPLARWPTWAAARGPACVRRRQSRVPRRLQRVGAGVL